MEQKSNAKIFCFKNKFLNFSETKKFSSESLTFRELQPLVSYKRVSYIKKITCITFVRVSILPWNSNHLQMLSTTNYKLVNFQHPKRYLKGQIDHWRDAGRTDGSMY